MIKIKTSPLPNSDIRGMTVVQVLVATCLILVVIGAGIAPYLIQQEYLKKQFNRTRLQDELSIVMSYITRDAFRAKRASFQPTRLDITIDTNLNFPPGEETVTYRLLGTEVRRTAGGSTATIASNIRPGNGLQFSTTGNNYVNITVTAQREGETMSMESGVALRCVAPI